MTDIVEASTDRVAQSLAVNAGRHAGINEYIIPESKSPFFDPPLKSALNTSELKGFSQNNFTSLSDPDFRLRLTGGEAFIGGAYCARDTQSIVEADLKNGERYIGVGWSATGSGGVESDTLTVQPADQFGTNDRYLTAWRVTDSGPDDTRPRDRALGVEQFEYSGGTAQALVPGVSTIDIREISVLGVIQGDTELLRVFGNVAAVGPQVDVLTDMVVEGKTTTEGRTLLGDGSDVTTVRDVLEIQGRNTDPPTLRDGMVWYRSDNNEYRVFENGSIKTLDTTTV